MIFKIIFKFISAVLNSLMPLLYTWIDNKVEDSSKLNQQQEIIAKKDLESEKEQ